MCLSQDISEIQRSRMVQTIVSKSSGYRDILNSFKAWRLLGVMSFQDIKQRYRGSVLGPIWIAGSLLAISLGVASLYSSLFNKSFTEFMPFVVVGMSIWLFISACISEGCTAFLNSGGLMRNTSLPVFIHSLRVVGRNVIVLAHNAVVIALVFLIFAKPVNIYALLVIPAMILNIVAILWMVYLVAIASARFRDVGQIVTYMITVVMFLTPLFWDPKEITGSGRLVLEFNPFYHMIELVREPLLGALPSQNNWIAINVIVVGGGLLSLGVHSAFHRKIILWL